MTITKAQLLKCEIEEKLRLHTELLDCEIGVQPQQVSRINFRERMAGLEAEFTTIICRTGDLGNLFQRNALVPKYFHDLFLVSRMLQEELKRHMEKLLRTETPETAEEHKHRSQYMFFLNRQYQRYLDKLSFILAHNHIPSDRNFWQYLGTTYVPPDLILQKQFEEQLIPKKVALAHVLEMDLTEPLLRENAERRTGIFCYLFGGLQRTLAGNIRVLSANSNEDRTKYTSWKFVDYWRNILKGKGPIG